MGLRHRMTSAPTLRLLLVVVASCCRITTGQPNMRYPPLDKPGIKKQGMCYTVTHTFASYFNTDETPLLNPSATRFQLVDRHTGSIVPGACTASKVLVSTDSTAVDMGTFRRAKWAGQALRLEQGMVVADYGVIRTNLDRTAAKQAKKRLASKAPVGGFGTTFMMYFECPKTGKGFAAAGKGSGFGAKQGLGSKQGVGAKQPVKRTAFSVAMRYVSPNATAALASTPFQAFAEAASVASMLVYTNEQAFWQEGDLLLGDNGAPFDPSSVHRPWCSRIRSLNAVSAYCPALAAVQRALLKPSNAMFNCKYNYPAAVQPNIQQSQALGTDLQGQALPGPFENLLANPSGRLPDTVPQATTDAESATLAWLFDKTTQLALYAPCTGGGSIPFASTAAFAPNFGPSTLHYVTETREAPASNFTYTPLAYSGTGPDRDGLTTTVVAFRGTMSASEWATNVGYNQRLIKLESPPALAPWVGLQIHNGYSLLLEEIYPSIKAAVTAANPQRIMVTGHSLGGGMATLVAYGLAVDFPAVRVDAALFAPPSVGNPAFVDAFNRLVNARRIAFRASKIPNTVFLSNGDPVGQVLCPSHPQCWFDDPNLVSTKESEYSLDDYVSYRAVAANVLFGFADMPEATYPGVPADTIQETYKGKDILLSIIWSHICAYSCYFSTNVDFPLNRCYGKGNVQKYGNAIPPQVQQYGLCAEPPPVLPNGDIYGLDLVWYGDGGI